MSQESIEGFQKEIQQKTTKMLTTLSLVQQKLKDYKKNDSENYSEIELDIKTIEKYKTIFNQGFYFQIGEVSTEKLINQYKAFFLFMFDALKKTIQGTILYTLEKDDPRYITIESYKTEMDKMFNQLVGRASTTKGHDTLVSFLLTLSQGYIDLVEATYECVVKDYEKMYSDISVRYAINPILNCDYFKHFKKIHSFYRLHSYYPICDKYMSLYADVLTKLWAFNKFFAKIKLLQSLENQQKIDQSNEAILALVMGIIKNSANTIENLEQVNIFLEENYEKIINIAKIAFDYFKNTIDTNEKNQSFVDYRKAFFDILLDQAQVFAKSINAKIDPTNVKVFFNKKLSHLLDFDLADLIIYIYGRGYKTIINELLAFLIVNYFCKELMNCAEKDVLYDSIVESSDNLSNFSFKEIQNDIYQALKSNDMAKLNKIYEKTFEEHDIDLAFKRNIDYTDLLKNTKVNYKNYNGLEYIDLVKERIKKFDTLLNWTQSNGYYTEAMQLQIERLKSKDFFPGMNRVISNYDFIADSFVNVLLGPLLQCIKEVLAKNNEEKSLQQFEEFQSIHLKNNIKEGSNFDNVDVVKNYIEPLNTLHKLYLKSTYKNIFKKAINLNLIEEKEIDVLIKDKPNKNIFIKSLFEYLKDNFLRLYKTLPLDENDLNDHIKHLKNMAMDQNDIEDTINRAFFNLENKHIIIWAKENNLLPLHFYFTDDLKGVIKNKLRTLFGKANFQDLLHKLDEVETLQGLTGLYNEYLILNNQMKQNQHAQRQAQVPTQQPPSAYSLSGIWNRMTSWYSKLRFKKPAG